MLRGWLHLTRPGGIEEPLRRTLRRGMQLARRHSPAVRSSRLLYERSQSELHRTPAENNRLDELLDHGDVRGVGGVGLVVLRRGEVCSEHKVMIAFREPRVEPAVEALDFGDHIL
eukprot:CAMPEP_0182804744 /NCGR_PEP_ID=MMETSP0006_2-20121128/4711_1 /TAXON_ID=97485 /ORGANISM="Prymnesium parvum, Strain Texoma1" /LENGTH=114 /DNA_ID=CAMNT_0024930277 /DNA_START=256 /DNA_END=600 /DNA_ORIENTATION=-